MDSPENLQEKAELPPIISELVSKNASLAQTVNSVTREAFGVEYSSVSRFAVVVIKPGHLRFGQIARLANDYRSGYDIRFIDDCQLSFQWKDLAFLDKSIFTENDKKIIVAAATGADMSQVEGQILLPCPVVVDSIRLYLTDKYITKGLVTPPSPQVLAHGLYCPEESCFGLFELLAYDHAVETGNYPEGWRVSLVNYIKNKVLRI